jgi:hypothetical protein
MREIRGVVLSLVLIRDAAVMGLVSCFLGFVGALLTFLERINREAFTSKAYLPALLLRPRAYTRRLLFGRLWRLWRFWERLKLKVMSVEIIADDLEPQRRKVRLVLGLPCERDLCGVGERPGANHVEEERLEVGSDTRLEARGKAQGLASLSARAPFPDRLWREAVKGAEGLEKHPRCLQEVHGLIRGHFTGVV